MLITSDTISSRLNALPGKAPVERRRGRGRRMINGRRQGDPQVPFVERGSAIRPVVLVKALAVVGPLMAGAIWLLRVRG